MESRVVAGVWQSTYASFFKEFLGLCSIMSNVLSCISKHSSHFLRQKQIDTGSMSSKLPAILLLLISLRCAISMFVSVYSNSQWIPFDKRYGLGTLSLIDSAAACLCLCNDNPICFVTTYFGNDQTCSLFFGQIDQGQGQLQLMNTNTNTQVYDFGNRSIPGKQSLVDGKAQVSSNAWSSLADIQPQQSDSLRNMEYYGRRW